MAKNQQVGFVSEAKLDRVQSSIPLNRSKKMMLMYYGEEVGGWVDIRAKMEGDVYVPATSMVEGRCILKDVRLPVEFTVIGLKVHGNHTIDKKIGRFEYVENYRIRHGIYVTGYIDPAEHICEDHHNLMGYDLVIFGRKHLPKDLYYQIQKRLKEQDFAGMKE